MLVFSVCKKNLISSLRGEYIDFIVSRFTFTIFTVAMAVILHNLQNRTVSQFFLNTTGGNDYLGFVVVGTALYGTTHGILLNVSRYLMAERREGTLEAVLIISFSRLSYYFGNQLHQLMLSVLDALMAIVISVMIGVTFKVSSVMLLAYMFQPFITLYGLATLISLLMISLKDTYFIQNTIIPIVLLLGGFLLLPYIEKKALEEYLS